MTTVGLPEQFESWGEARRNGFLAIKKLKDDGKKVVGAYCTFTPAEIILAAGAVSVGLCGVSEEPIPDAEKVLPRNLCPMVKSSYGHAITDTCPYFYFSDIVVAETTCDGKKKMYEQMAKVKPTHIMHLPNMVDEAAIKLWANEIERFKEKLEEFYGITITEDDIRAAIKDKNEERALLMEYFKLGALNPPPMSGMDIHRVLYQTQFKFDRPAMKAELRKLIDDIKAEYNATEHKKSNRPRILITGSPIAGAINKIAPAIEEAGGDVVVYENCGGPRSNRWLVDEENPDVYEAIAEAYLKIGCSCMMNNDRRIELLDELIDEFQIDGVIDIALTACHTFTVESARIKEFVTKEKGISFLSLETDYSQSDSEQLKTRFEAFVEML